MKRIVSVLLFVGAVLLCACTDERIVDPDSGSGSGSGTEPKTGNISLKILVPTGSVSTYADADASVNENHIETLYVELYQAGVKIDDRSFSGTQLENNPADPADPNDSILMVGYEVDNIVANQNLTARVYANNKNVRKITGEIPLPSGDAATSFFMSGEITTPLSYNSSNSAYEGTVQLVRNVAKVRVNIMRNSVVFPSDLRIDYDNVKIHVLKVADSTSLFQSATPISGHSYINYAERSGTGLRRSASFKNTPSGPDIKDDGGQIDSFYVYENFQNAYTYSESDPLAASNNVTCIKVTVPTISNTEGVKDSSYTYALYTENSFTLKRNYIYTLEIRMRGSSLEPVITVSVKPWDDVNMDGNIYGTYLTLDNSEIVFDANGKASIDFCTDAQAVYFDFSEFNNSNSKKIEINGTDINAIDIEKDDGLAPADFKSGQILLDRQHCGRFGFELDPDDFPGFPAVNFSGRIRMKAGNIVKYLTFPAVRVLDAHFIVGDSIWRMDTTYTRVDVENPGSNTDWLKISENRIYASSQMVNSYSGSAKPVYLHLDENLTGATRTGSISVTTSAGGEKKIRIAQLPAIRVGRFGYNSYTSTDDSIYSATLYTEQLYEFETMPEYTTGTSSPVVPGNAIYNGRMTAATSGIFTWTHYSSSSDYFNYRNEVYRAINYCAYKNRITGASPGNSDFKWYLPSQAQLMGMWLSYASYKDMATSNFKRNNSPADVFWSSTDNKDYANSAQYMNFKFGNSGHIASSSTLWARCVRDSIGASPSASMISTVSGDPLIDFRKGMPAESYTDQTKGQGGGDELSSNNNTLYQTLRVALNDEAVGVVAWDIDACPTGWRLPTQRELQAIWILQSEIEKEVPGFTLLADDYYWSATDATGTNGTNAWTVFGSRSRVTPGASGNAPHQHKMNSRLRVRCVKEE